MPRQSRIDAPGALHHVIVRGIARRRIFYDDTDRQRFLERLGAILRSGDTACFAWALIPNHFHLGSFIQKIGHFACGCEPIG